MSLERRRMLDEHPRGSGYVIWEWWRELAIYALTLLIAADIALTIIGVGMGATETNPSSAYLLASHGIGAWLFARVAAYTIAIGGTYLMTPRQGAVWLIAMCGMHVYPLLINGAQLLLAVAL